MILALALLAALGPASTVARAGAPEPERVAIRAAPHLGYGRLVFDWPKPIAFERRDAEGAVIIRFARPFAADLGAVPERLGEYLRAVERTDDGRGVRLHPRAGVRARLSHFDPDLVVVDLERHGAGEPPDDPGVAVRTGEHEGFIRIVFDWPGPVAFRQQRDGRDLTLAFDRKGRIDAVALGRRLQPWLQELTAGADGEGTRVRLRLEPGLDARAFPVEDTRVVVDLLEEPRDGEAQTSAQADAEVPAGSPRAGSATPAQRSAAASAEAAVAAAERARGRTPLDGIPPEAGPAAAGETGAVALAIAAAPHDDGIVLTFTWARPVAAAVFIRGGHLWTVFDAPVSQDDFPPALGPAVDAYLGPARAVALDGGTALQFPLSRAVRAQVARDGAAWRVTLGDRAAEPRPVPLERLGEPPRLRLRAADGGGLLHLVDPAVGDRLSVWPLLEPGRGRPRARRMVDLELLESAQGVVWRPLADRLEVELTGRGVTFDAPGGLFLSSPAAPPSAAARAGDGEDGNGPSGVDGNVHAAAAVDEARTDEPPADEMPAEEPSRQPAAPDGGTEHANRDEAAQEESARDEAARDEATPDEATSTAETSSAKPSPAAAHGPLGLAGAASGRGANLTARRGALIRAVERAAPEDRGRARLDLARFYLARGLAPETLAVLRHRDEPDATASAAPELAQQSLTGAAELLMGHLEAAEAALEAPALDDDREVALWRAVLAAARNDWPAAAGELRRSERILESYPAALQVRLGVPAALIAVESGDSPGALEILRRLADLELHAVERARVSFVRGLAHARAGAIDEADRIWRHLAQGAHDETRIKATYARTTMRLDAGRIDPPTALAELEAARPLWRGHPWELTMLDVLARTRAEAGDPAGAIRTWQEALRRFPEAARGPQMKEAMRATFKDAVLAADEHALDPLRSLALYRDFPDLTPQDEEAKRLRRRLAERLAALDLIEPAAALLGTLIEDHPGGIAKAEAGADLAELWLRAPDAEAALEAIEASGAAAGLPEPLSKRRQLLRARALARLDRPQAALEVLARRHDPPAERLRLAVHWQDEAWSEVIPSIERLLERQGDLDLPLGEDEQALVIRLAIAHAHLGDTAALARLRTRFGPALRGEPGEAAFSVATMTPARDTPDTAAVLAAAEDHIGRFEAYLAEPTSGP